MKWYWILLIALGAFFLGWFLSKMTNKTSLPAVTTTTTTTPEGNVVNETSTGTAK